MNVKITATATFEWFWLLRDLRPGAQPATNFGPFQTEEESKEWETKMRVVPYPHEFEGRSFVKDYALGSGLEWFAAPTSADTDQGYGLVRRLTQLSDVVELPD